MGEGVARRFLTPHNDSSIMTGYPPMEFSYPGSPVRFQHQEDDPPEEEEGEPPQREREDEDWSEGPSETKPDSPDETKAEWRKAPPEPGLYVVCGHPFGYKILQIKDPEHTPPSPRIHFFGPIPENPHA